MACIVPTPAVTDLAEVYSNKKDFTGEDHEDSHISKNIQKLNNEQVTHSQEQEDVEEDVEKNLGDVCDVFMSSNEESCYYNQEKLETIETSSRGFNKIHPNDGINLNESSKENKLRDEVTKSYDTDNDSNAVKMLRKSLSFMDSNSAKETDLDETLNKNSSIVDDEYHSGSLEYLQITEHNNSKNKSLRRIVDSESEEDTRTSKCNNFPQTVHHIISTTVSNHIIYKHHHPCYNFLNVFICKIDVNNI